MIYNNELVMDCSSIQFDQLDLFNQIPAKIGIKDKNGRYVAVNMAAALLAGFKNPKDFIGRRDVELKCKAATLHKLFEEQDKKVLAGENQTNLDVAEYSDNKIRIFLSTKNKISDKNNNLFILGMMNEIPFRSLSRIFFNLNQRNHKNIRDLSGSFSVVQASVETEEKTVKLTEKQAECLFYLLQGKTIKEIAYIINRSVKTIDEHVANLKQIFNCYSKSQLIEKAYEQGYAYIIPPSLLYSVV